MNILVLVKPVPDPKGYGEIEIDPVTKCIIRESIPWAINPADRNALEAALTLGKEASDRGEESHVTVMAMAPCDTKDKILECLAMGADEGILISDRIFAGSDTYATSLVLATAIEKAAEVAGEDYDLILAGNESADGATAQVPVQVATRLGMKHMTRVCSIALEDKGIRVTKKSEELMLTFKGNLPALAGVTQDINKPRLINAMGIIKARKKKIQIWSNEDLGIRESEVGLEGSPTKPGELIEANYSRESRQIQGDTPKDAAREILTIVRKSGII